VLVGGGGRDSWAQMEQTLQAQPWVRLTCGRPKRDGVADEPRPDVREAWISTDHKVAAHRSGLGSGLLDLARNVVYYDDSRTKTLNLWRTREQVVHLRVVDTLLRLIAGENDGSELTGTPLRIVGRTRSEVQDGNRRWIEFRLVCRTATEEFPLIVRVDPETQLPVELRRTGRFSPDQPADEQTIAIDYPKVGPADIYALGVPRDAVIVDQRRSRVTEHGAELQTFLDQYVEARAKPLEPHVLTILTSRPGTDFAELSEAYRGRDDCAGTKLEAVHPRDPLFELSRKVRRGDITPPEAVDRAVWWREQIAGLTFAPTQEFPPGLLPGRVGYPEELLTIGPSPIDNPDVEITLDRSPRSGPTGTVLLKLRVETTLGSNDLYFWIAPEKDYLVLRQDVHYSKNHSAWDNSTRIIDAVAQSPNGRWYATQARYGRIEKHGDDLPANTEAVAAGQPADPTKLGPVTTQAYCHLVDFQ
jgi:hypothetical protein